MSLSRRTLALAAGAALSLPSSIIALAQDALDEIPEGALRQQVAWFVDVLNAGTPLTVAEVEAHFTPGFLAQVPARQVVETVEGLKPQLGTVTVEHVATGTTEVEAGVLLVGATGLRVRLTVWIEPATGLIDGLTIQPDDGRTGQQDGIPVAASAYTAPAPPTTQDILADYEAASAALLAAGREATNALLAGDDSALNAMISDDVAEVFPGIPVQELLTSIETSIVSFSLSAVNALFAGHFAPEGITGLFHQGTPAAFALLPDEPQLEDYPIGSWTGDIIIGTFRLGIEVTFAGTADTLTATMSIPEQGFQDVPLDDVLFERERPIGALVEERALPLGPTMGTSGYGASYAWGPTTLVLSAAFDADLRLIGLAPAMQPPMASDPAAGIDAADSFMLPFEGAWLVVWGGDNEFRNYHAPTGVQRHASDIVIWRDGATYSGDGTRNEDYHCYGQPLVAPVGGTVAAAIDGYADDVPGSPPTADPTLHPAGNHLVIEVAPEQYLLMAHLRPGSIVVEEGDVVQAGDPVGLTGNSGNSTEPHLHIHLQTTPDMFDPLAIGLPLAFTGLMVNGEPVEMGMLEQGQIIERA